MAFLRETLSSAPKRCLFFREGGCHEGGDALGRERIDIGQQRDDEAVAPRT